MITHHAFIVQSNVIKVHPGVVLSLLGAHSDGISGWCHNHESIGKATYINPISLQITDLVTCH